MAFFETEKLSEHLFHAPEPQAEERDVSQAREQERLRHYLRAMGAHKQLTREEEGALARKARKGDEAAKQALVLGNLPFVVSIAKKFAGRGANRLDDLIQEGNVGLMKAVDHFDPNKNVRFATYAVWWIRAYITRYLRDNRSHVRGGDHERSSMTDCSLDSPIDDESDSTLLDHIEARSPGADDVLLSVERDVQVSEALARVRRRIGDLGWDIVQERLTQERPRTLEDLGARWGVSRERVRQVELKTKSFLARYLGDLGTDAEVTEIIDAAA
jgi:RNA polymerase primary sigma factor